MKKRQAEEARTDLTTVAIKRTTRDKLDNLGFDRHASYDSIINAILERQKESKTIEGLSKEIQEIHQLILSRENIPGTVDYIMDSIVEDYKEIRYNLQMEEDSPQTTMLSSQVLSMLGHYLDVAEKSGIPPRWNETLSRYEPRPLDPKKQQKKKQVVRDE